VVAAALALSIPVWWAGLRWWAEASGGYLDLDASGMSPVVWLALVAFASAVLVIRAIRPVRIATTASVAIAATGVAFHNLAEGLADGAISGPGWVLGILSGLQLAGMVAGAFATTDR